MNIKQFRESPSIHRWNRAHAGAYRKGARAYCDGEKITACPYGDIRDSSGKLTWSRAFMGAWRDGWKDAAKQDYENAHPACDCGNPNPYWSFGKGSQTRREYACHSCHNAMPS